MNNATLIEILKTLPLDLEIKYRCFEITEDWEGSLSVTPHVERDAIYIWIERFPAFSRRRTTRKTYPQKNHLEELDLK